MRVRRDTFTPARVFAGYLTWTEEERRDPGDSFLIHQSEAANPVESGVVVEIDGLCPRALDVELDNEDFLNVLDVEVNLATGCHWI